MVAVAVSFLFLQIKELNAEVEKKVTDLRTRLEEEQKKQIVLIKQVRCASALSETYLSP